MLFSSRVTVRVRIRFSVWLVSETGTVAHPGAVGVQAQDTHTYIFR